MKPIRNNKTDNLKFLQSVLDNIDIKTTFGQLEKELSISEKKMSRSQLSRALDMAPSLRYKAGKIWIIAKQRRRNFDNQMLFILGELEVKARKRLASMKTKKQIDGQVTTAFIERYMAKNFEEYRKLLEQRATIKRDEDLLEILYNSWVSRASLLQSQAKQIESRITQTPNQLNNM